MDNRSDAGTVVVDGQAWTQQDRLALANKVRPAREAAGLTQEALAERAGVSRGTVSNIESGKMIPQADVLRRVLTALDIGPRRMRSSDVDAWLEVIAPLVEALSDSKREQVMRDVMALLVGAAVPRREAEPAPDRSTNPAAVLGIGPTEDLPRDGSTVMVGSALSIPMPTASGHPTPQPDSAEDTAGR